jgi:hypothetical protein
VKEIVALPALEHVSNPWDIGSASGKLRARSGTGTFKHINIASQFFGVTALVYETKTWCVNDLFIFRSSEVGGVGGVLRQRRRRWRWWHYQISSLALPPVASGGRSRGYCCCRYPSSCTWLHAVHFHNYEKVIAIKFFYSTTKFFYMFSETIQVPAPKKILVPVTAPPPHPCTISLIPKSPLPFTFCSKYLLSFVIVFISLVTNFFIASIATIVFLSLHSHK